MRQIKLLKRLDAKIKDILWGELLTAPVVFHDVGIGGGERYTYGGNNGNSGILNVIVSDYKVRMSNERELIKGEFVSVDIKDNIITLYIRKEDCRKNFDISKYDMRFREM